MHSSPPSSKVLMIRPVHFGFNEETAVNNAFQHSALEEVEQQQIARKAQYEFDEAVIMLRKHHVEVVVLEDTAQPVKPDAIFPNNWFSVHNQTLVTYPMYAVNRRMERVQSHIERIKEIGNIERHIQLEQYEAGQIPHYLEGTGSLVLDRTHKIAYAALSERTHEELVDTWCQLMGYQSVKFKAIGPDGHPIYHTNVMMHVGTDYVMMCTECIPDKAERKRVLDGLEQLNKLVIELNTEQTFESFAGNMLQLRTQDDKKLVTMSHRAYESLTPLQLAQLKQYNDIILPLSIPTIEHIGGGSVRCMLAEL
jgi:hypothetical protein